ncbi:hypothetical protein CHGG_05955 [Chaetomium globosum CBS 148.51]|uniref:FAD/NAD(P)-binding domain-containing protein n=1 Tax=Chaetomium globosum (strain ATCC 6205 / CBS 148.51 / DSM 1962 / NBRC 6347 / NRRL 1970) TaxID=306901 RepID=Q2H5W0_CHAGB|nr:uncharacterized protein CHGG_05955 [Chaetomium globosum CBS 148.51]EAQ89336.1 hypothetical protein CHGG_05955 [Chaetomium globosum CBS 148.51]
MGEMPTRNGYGQNLGNHFTIKDAPIENLRPFRVVVVGAGFSGILAAIRIPERLRNVELAVYEKNEGVGGVCNLYAPGVEIQQYLQDVAERFGAMRFIKTRHQVEHCEWDESEKKCYDFRNKRIGIIGNGSSAIQIIPKLQMVEGAQLTCFMRSPTWISSAFGDSGMTELGLDPSNTAFSPEQRHKLSTDPEALFKLRKVFETGGNLIHDSTIRGTAMQQKCQAAFHQAMHAKLHTRPDLLSLLIPSFSPGCRRLTPGKGFLEALLEPNVTVVSDAITGITPSGITTTTTTPSPATPTHAPPTTTTHPLTTLILATGYTVSSAPPFPIHGRSSLALSTRWHTHPDSYLSLAVDQFPNLFMLFGPNSAIGTGSLTRMLEAATEYAVACVRKLQREDYASMEVRAERVRDFGAYVDAYFERTVYTEECRSWYRRGGRVVGLWPGSTLHALEALRAPRWEDWVYESVDGGEAGGGNGLRWLGDGSSETQVGGDASWYINPGEVQVPVEGRPEENERYKARPWCY